MNEKPRELFLKGCNEIEEAMIPQGFKVTQKGQTVSKRPNKDITLQIYFQSSHYNNESSVTIIPFGKICQGHKQNFFDKFISSLFLS